MPVARHLTLTLKTDEAASKTGDITPFSRIGLSDARGYLPERFPSLFIHLSEASHFCQVDAQGESLCPYVRVREIPHEKG